MTVFAASSWRSNAELIEDVVRLGYIRPDDRVIDLTYGQGIWWKNYDHPGHFTAMFHDAVDPPKKGAARLAERARTHPTAGTAGDFTRLHMQTAAYEVVAFDPPYVCVSLDTEIFTARGWLKWAEVQVGDRAYTLNHGTGRGEWQPISDIHVLPPSHRTLLSMEGLSHSSLSTSDHRWPILTRARAGRPVLRGFRRSDAFRADDVVPTAARIGERDCLPMFSDSLVELVAWFWTEGHIEGRRAGEGGQGAYGNICQSRITNPDNCARIERCLLDVFGPAVESFPRLGRRTDGVPRWRKTVDGPNHRYWLSADAGRHLMRFAPNLIPSLAWLSSLPPRQLDLFVEVSLLADGHVTPAGRASLGQKNKEMAEAFGAACILSGRSVTYTTDPSRGHVVSVRKRPVFKPSRNNPRWVPDDGPVWCVTVPNSTWLARRNGTVYFTGNCLGGRTTIGEDVAGFVAGYGLRDAPRTPDDMRAFIAQGLAEATRICVPGGILLVKCAPYISSGKLQLGDHWLLEDALALGLRVEERFIHVGHVRPQPGGRRVVHARNNYSVLFVFRTPPARKSPKKPAEPNRGVSYADGGFAATTVHYPDPARVAAIHDEWRTQ